jgi:hypothetical protein
MHSIAALIAAVGLTQAPPVTPSETADTEELFHLEEVWNDAHIHGEAKVLDSLWADGFVVTVPRMPAMSKPDALGVWRSGHVKFQRYHSSDVAIRLYGNTAVVTGRLQRTRDFNGKTVDDDWRFTKTCVRRDPRWQVAAFHASESPAEATNK